VSRIVENHIFKGYMGQKTTFRKQTENIQM